MERYVAAVCACLEGDVNLWPREVPRFESSDELLPVPWITVLFRAETKSNAGNTRNPSVHHNTNTTPSNANANDYHGSVDRNEALTRQVHDKVAAIRFLSLVARYPEYSWRGNPLFWKHVLNDICDSSSCNVYFPPPQSSSFRRREKPPNCAPARNAGEVYAMPKFQLIFSSLKVKNELLELCTQAFSSSPNYLFQRVDQCVQAIMTKLGVAIPHQPRSVKIDLDFSRSRLRLADSKTGIQNLLLAASSRKETRNSSIALFSVRCLNLSQTTISERDLSPLAQIMALPASTVSELALDLVFTAKTSKRFMQSFCEFVSACFAVSLSGAPVTTSLTKLSLNFSKLSNFQLGSLFSAIHDGNSRFGVRDLSLHGLEGSDAWLWLAFGIFHPTSKSPIEHLDLSHCVLRLEDIETVRNLLKSTDYLPCLMQKKITSGPDTSHQSHWALLQAGTRLEIPRGMKKHSRGKPAPALTLETELWCELLDSGVSWACVLIPAYGKLYVKNSKIVKTETRARSKHSCKLKALTMMGVKTTPQFLRVGEDGALCGPLEHEHIDCVLSEWVKTVGQSLETLHLPDNALRTSTLDVILEACPLLKNLDVSECELTDIGPITRALRRESCSLRTLNAAQNHISAASQEEFFRLLRGTECHSIQHLQVLQLEDNPTSHENRTLNVLYSSLRRNKTLRYLVLSINEKHTVSRDLRWRFGRDHHDSLLGHESLPCQHRLALLSVAMVTTLPTAVIDIIFDFARREIRRQVLWE
ncbi:hypothetical protein AM587_10007173 [Phytophthora nicotianae]|uniref:Uncharacterized protein n=1 Tax=Phytophthora nicotianae TaxID=4792 RepID=A0A0W8CSY8_PHYNI|nr:hypothetical protein AM587_10007173 [Phytophthora nicotianae]